MPLGFCGRNGRMKTEEMPAESMTVAEMFVRALEHEGVSMCLEFRGRKIWT